MSWNSEGQKPVLTMVCSQRTYFPFIFLPLIFQRSRNYIENFCTVCFHNLFTNMISRNQLSFHLHIYFNIWSTLQLMRTGLPNELKQSISMWQYCSLKTSAFFLLDQWTQNAEASSCPHVRVFQFLPNHMAHLYCSVNDFHVQCELFEVMLHLSLI